MSIFLSLALLILFMTSQASSTSFDPSSFCQGPEIQTSPNPSIILMRRASHTLKPRAPPATFTANPAIGPGGSSYRDSAHFRFYSSDLSVADTVLRMLEGAYSCYVDDLGWRSTGLSYNLGPNANGPWTKVNVYSVTQLPTGIAGVMTSDPRTGMAWIRIRGPSLTSPVTVHEFGHALHYHQKTWVNSKNTGAWWEAVAEALADFYLTSSVCQRARTAFQQGNAKTSKFDIRKTIGDSYQVIVDATPKSGNHYQAWPFFSYLSNNPDEVFGLGRNVMLQLMVQYSPRSNETPLHTLQRISTKTTVSKIIGKYWARMAYLDIGNQQAQSLFFAQRSRANFVNLDSTGTGTYRVKSARRPRYMGANINPLKNPSGTVTVKITTSGQLTSHLVARNPRSGAVRYVEVLNGAGSINVASGEEASLVVANTPAKLILFDPSALGPEVNTGVAYSFTLSGATA